MLPSAWRLLIVTDGCTSSDWSLGPMLVCVHLGDICVMIGSSLMFLVFFVYVLIRNVGHICFITTIVPTVTVSDCLFRGVWGFCVNVRVPLQLFSLMSPSVWPLLIITDGHASSDWSLGPMLVCVRLGDVCVVLGSSLVFLVFLFMC